MNKIIEYLFEGFLIMIFCTAIMNWFSDNENLNALIDVTKEHVESDNEVINTSHVALDQKYGESLAVIPFDVSYTKEGMLKFINRRSDVRVGGTEASLTNWNSSLELKHKYVEVDNYLYELHEDNYKLIRR